MISNTKTKLKKSFSYIWINKKRPKVWIPAIITIIILIIIVKPNSTSASYEVVQVAPADFIQEVSVTGKVVPAQKVDLGFEYSGRLAKVNTTVGAVVKKGQILASLSNADYYANLQKSQAAYLGEQARLADIQKGNRPESIAIAEADVVTAQQNVTKAKADLVEQIKDSYAVADDAIRNKSDGVFNNPRSNNPELTFFVENNTTLRRSLENQRIRVTEILTAWQKLNALLNANTISDVQAAEAVSNAALIQRFMNDLSLAVSSVNSSLASSDTFQQHQANISIARTNVNATVSALNSDISAVKNTESALARANQSLTLERSGSTAEEIRAAQANAQGAAASVSAASASLSKTVINAPFDGIVTRVQYKTGESVNAAEPIITLMSDASFEIETFVSENDVPKLKIGQIAKVTLDALGDATVFEATVSEVDLSETIKDGVVTYRMRLQFTTRDERIKSGLTTNVIVETDKRSNVIKVPQTAIVISNGKKNIKIAPAGTTAWSKDIDDQSKLVAVTTGGIDREGYLEVISGISVGDSIIVKSVAKK
jgi:HlyD family secretion protein